MQGPGFVWTGIYGFQLDRKGNNMASTEPGKSREFGRRMLTTSLALILLLSVALPQGAATEIETYAFEKVWWHTDLPVAMNRTNRTWVWGPEPFTPLLLEPYDEGAVSGVEGARWVQYFDKTRVEITRPDQSRTDGWYVTNGLLAHELITGRMQIGDSNHVVYEPAEINVAGDSDDLTAPTYRSLNRVMEFNPLPAGSVITQTINRDGAVADNSDYARHNVTTLKPTDATDRTIAEPFWEFMTSQGVIYDGFDFVEGRLFQQPFFATGLPIAEPYWTTVRIAGEPRDVLIQAFQRRVLTYTPGNPQGWAVEAANVGRHYYRWRYGDGVDQALGVSGVYQKQDLSGNLILMGEVENRARASYGEVELTLELLDESGEVVGEFRSWLDSAMIEPGERLPFQIWTEFRGEYADYRIGLRSRPSHRFYRPSVTLTESNGVSGSNLRFDISGTLRNDSGRPVDFLQFVVALYDAEGRVIGYRWGVIEPITLQPGAETRFETSFFDPPRFDSYRIIITD